MFYVVVVSRHMRKQPTSSREGRITTLTTLFPAVFTNAIDHHFYLGGLVAIG